MSDSDLPPLSVTAEGGHPSPTRLGLSDERTRTRLLLTRSRDLEIPRGVIMRDDNRRRANEQRSLRKLSYPESTVVLGPCCKNRVANRLMSGIKV